MRLRLQRSSIDTDYLAFARAGSLVEISGAHDLTLHVEGIALVLSPGDHTLTRTRIRYTGKLAVGALAEGEVVIVLATAGG